MKGEKEEGQLEESISPTFYARLFRAKVLCEAFLCLRFRFELYFGARIFAQMRSQIFMSAIKTLTFTSSTNMLCAKLSYKKAACKMLVKLTRGGGKEPTSSLWEKKFKRTFIQTVYRFNLKL